VALKIKRMDAATEAALDKAERLSKITLKMKELAVFTSLLHRELSSGAIGFDELEDEMEDATDLIADIDRLLAPRKPALVYGGYCTDHNKPLCPECGVCPADRMKHTAKCSIGKAGR
jgi:hypothetical protein